MEQELSKVEIGQKVVIRKIFQSPLRSKMLELGFQEGTLLEVLFKSPFSGPIAVKLENSIISMRKNEAALILTEVVSNHLAV